MEKMAHIYLRENRYIIHSIHWTSDEIGIVAEPSFAIKQPVDEREFGLKVLASLDGSKENVPPPLSHNEISRKLWSLGGVRSWAAFNKNSECVEIVDEKNGLLVMTPMINRGPKWGYEPDESRQVSTADRDPRDLAEHIIRLLDECSRRSNSVES